MTEPAVREIAISLVSHTNAGKTSLARTLLGRDVGEVRDEAHVTERADAYLMLETSTGDRLLLWDTPGFGDSIRLARRLALSGNPIGWVLTEVWDRLRNRPFWSSQQAIRHVRDGADVVLYLINAAEDPQDATYVPAEMRILAWIGKPVIVLLNQLGPPRAPALEAAERDRWADQLSGQAGVHAVLALDAFARCWVQETLLLDALADAMPGNRRAAFDRLKIAWRARHEAVFASSMNLLAQRLALAAADREALADTGLAQRLREAGARVGLGSTSGDSAAAVAQRTLAQRLDRSVRESTNALISAHGLAGEAGEVVLARLARHYTVKRRVDEGRAAILGGLITGSVAGLKADLATGGLTLGAGLIAGGLIGALSAAGLAHGYNRIRGQGQDSMAWANEVLDDLLVAALLGYLVVAHFGRGRGEWDSPDAPDHWEPIVREQVGIRHADIQAVWQLRQNLPVDASAQAALRDQIAVELDRLLTGIARKVLSRLYPDSPVTGPSSDR